MTARDNYVTRTYNLLANVPQALPPAREFLLVDASVDVFGVNIVVGDDNGALQRWPLGFAVGVKDGTIRARIMSSVNQTVTVTMATGAVSVKDSRFSPGSGSLAVTVADGADVAQGATTDAVAATDTGNATLVALIKRLLTKTPSNQYTTNAALGLRPVGSPTTGIAVLVAAGANVNGILVHSMFAAAAQDPTADLGLYDGTGAALLRVLDSQTTALMGPLIIPPGLQFHYVAVGGGTLGASYTIL